MRDLYDPPALSNLEPNLLHTSRFHLAPAYIKLTAPPDSSLIPVLPCTPIGIILLPSFHSRFVKLPLAFKSLTHRPSNMTPLLLSKIIVTVGRRGAHHTTPPLFNCFSAPIHFFCPPWRFLTVSLESSSPRSSGLFALLCLCLPSATWIRRTP